MALSRSINFQLNFRKLFLGASFTFVFSGLLVKTVRITMIFNMLGKKLVRDYKLFLRPTPQVKRVFYFFLPLVFIVFTTRKLKKNLNKSLLQL